MANSHLTSCHSSFLMVSECYSHHCWCSSEWLAWWVRCCRRSCTWAAFHWFWVYWWFVCCHQWSISKSSACSPLASSAVHWRLLGDMLSSSSPCFRKCLYQMSWPIFWCCAAVLSRWSHASTWLGSNNANRYLYWSPELTAWESTWKMAALALLSMTLSSTRISSTSAWCTHRQDH